VIVEVGYLPHALMVVQRKRNILERRIGLGLGDILLCKSQYMALEQTNAVDLNLNERVKRIKRRISSL
jgi:hypothetical protein